MSTAASRRDPIARIYQPAKTAMQSGRRKTGYWVLEFIPQERKVIEHIMGWTGSGDMLQQLKITFPTREEAVRYAQERQIPYEFSTPHMASLQIKAYADNFSFSRVRAYAGLTDTPAPTPIPPQVRPATKAKQLASRAALSPEEAAPPAKKAIEPAAATTKKMVGAIVRPAAPTLKPLAKKPAIAVPPRPVAGKKPSNKKAAPVTAPTKPVVTTKKPTKKTLTSVTLKKPVPKAAIKKATKGSGKK
jgi:hypothetical protein